MKEGLEKLTTPELQIMYGALLTLAEDGTFCDPVYQDAQDNLLTDLGVELILRKVPREERDMYQEPYFEFH